MPTLEIAQKKLDLARKAEEYYNALRTNIQLSGNNLKVISVTSVKPGEGKSTTSTPSRLCMINSTLEAMPLAK